MKKFLIALAVVAIVGAGVAYACCGSTDPPTIEAEVGPGELWPPNHKMVDITLDVTITNAMGWTIGVTSDEPDNAEGMGDGNTDNDIVIGVDEDGNPTLQLRAERCGTRGTGRTYTITLTTLGGNGVATTTATVFVPFSQKGGNQP